MTSSKELVKAIKEFEGFRSQAYKDSGGKWTIGYGHTLGVKQGMHVTTTEAEALLMLDLVQVEKQVNGLLEVDAVWDGVELACFKGTNVQVTQGQFDALVDFAFNLGFSRLKDSTLLRYVRGGWPYHYIMSEFLRWNKCRGKPLKGLTKRRLWEANRYLE